MPQMNKGGKFVFGWSLIQNDYTIQLPEMALEEYKISSEKKIILISGSKKTGGFCVSRKELIENSNINKLFISNPLLKN
ncbi:hypothetical protein JXR93_08385, partial [bacterium]|nr:hypothetical protein [bacterium]